ncbi:hypothetical protein [Caballeronia sp. BR00000012568055]|uniref:hypothetical protein n=1 Tax=Caballeronia sp. BR00000012568055 TaxID=2918761 RepID=UPI0023F70572|nr:hypothetical protein [Caballeronia sp. BR00000012568055]
MWQATISDLCFISTTAGQRSASLRTADGLEQLQAITEARGGTRLATNYTGRLAQYRFRCAQGHEWETEGGIVFGCSWCRRCAFDPYRSTLEEMQEIGPLTRRAVPEHRVSKRHVQADLGVRQGHVWDAVPGSVNGGTWCPDCAVLDLTKTRATRKKYDVEV